MPHFILTLALCTVALAQTSYLPQQIHVHDLPPITSPTPHASDVLAISVAIVFHDKELCCGKNSALIDAVEAADPKSLKDIAAKLQGRHLLSDGRPIMISTEYLTPDQVVAGHLIAMLADNHAPLMMWNSHLYVVEGVTYIKSIDPTSNTVAYAIQKFLLQDVRFSDSRRQVTFDRNTEDLSKVEGLLFVQSAPQ
jgi:hypothetical protein